MSHAYPHPVRQNDLEGRFLIPASVRVILPFSLKNLDPILNQWCDIEYFQSGKADLVFVAEADLPKEGYRLRISAEGIEITYRDYAGAFYALTTLCQLKDSLTNSLPCLLIEDHPALSLRGFMMDISRDKIPTVATVKSVIDKMASLKMNHLELYVEGFSFEYPSFPGVNEAETPITLAEFLELEHYAQVRAIDLCGNMNGFGHMTKWLERREFHALAECPSGFSHYGFHFPASTVNPLDPRSLVHARKMLDDLLPHTASPFFNINCDEPFELGRGKSRKACREKGLGRVYVDYVSELVKHVNRAGKTALVWGDVLINHPEVLDSLPKGMVFLDWGYDYDYPFEDHMKKLHDLGVKFVGCPGTSSWCSFASRKRDMLATVKNAVEGAVRFQGEGILLTDWGDFGHLQYLPFTYPGLICAGLSAWEGVAADEPRIAEILGTWMAPVLGQAILDLAGYSVLENQHVYNATLVFSPVMFTDPSPQHPTWLKRVVLRTAMKKYVLNHDSAESILKLVEETEQRIRTWPAEHPDDGLIWEEVAQTIRFLRMAATANLWVNHEPSLDRNLVKLEILSDLDLLLRYHPDLWAKRNKPGGLDRSIARLIGLKSIIKSMK